MQSNILTRSNPFYIHRGLRISDGSNKILSSFLFRGRWWNHCGGIRTSKSDALQLMSDVWRWLLVYSVCGFQFAKCAVLVFLLAGTFVLIAIVLQSEVYTKVRRILLHDVRMVMLF